MSDQIETKRCGAVPKRCSGSDGSNDEEPPLKRSLENGALHPSAQSVSNEPEVVNGSICPKVSDSTFATGNRNASIAKTKRTDKLSLLSQTFKPTMLGSRGSKTFSKRTDKKNTILEQSKHDWESFKSCEGLNEELKTYNRGKNGYIERQEFLQRTDQRQFEIERHLRSKQK